LHETYLSLTWRFPAPVEREAFDQYLSQLDPRDVVRAKGFVQFKNAPEKLYVFQAVRRYRVVEEFPAKPYPAPAAVLIGPRLDVDQHRNLLRQLVFGKGSKALKVV
jgi:G3E family GTPase